MADYEIRLLFELDPKDADDGLMPTVVEALDEYTEEQWMGEPDFWAEAKARKTPTRELIVRIPERHILALFNPRPLTLSAARGEIDIEAPTPHSPSCGIMTGDPCDCGGTL